MRAEGNIRPSSRSIIRQRGTAARRLFDLGQCKKFTTGRGFYFRFCITKKEELVMTQHPSPADTIADQRIMRQLATVVGCFIIATVAMAVAVGLIMG
jgi:hypothetical protein